MKEKCIIECSILKISKNFAKIARKYLSSKNDIKNKNFPYSNFNKYEVFYHDLNFMKYISPNNNEKLKEFPPLSANEKFNKKKYMSGKFITIVLNNTLGEHADKIIANSDILICADGGANRLYNLCLKLEKEKIINKKNDLIERYEDNNKIELENFKNEYVESIDTGDFSRNSMNSSYINTSEIDKNNILHKKINEKKDKHFKNKEKYSDNNIINNKLVNLFDLSMKRNKNDLKCSQKILPDLVCGDFDSIKSEVYNYYKSKSVLFERCTDQVTTDLDKCINIIKGYIKENDKIIILGATGNRFDQTCANISSLYKNISLNNIYLVGENNFLFLLKEGNHIININLNIFEKTCGILPVGKKCKVKTEGLKYNLNYEYLSFDTIISSSNEVVKNEIEIFNDSPILWYSQLKDI